MKVILIKDVHTLGNVGDVKDVADGYARNFLIPGGYVKIATDVAIKKSEEKRERAQKEMEEEFELAKKLAESLEGTSITIKKKADDSGKLYATIKQDEISRAFLKKELKIVKDKIIINEPIKKLGEHEVIINFDHGLEAKINLIVESEN